jgi:hypothetical protein
MAEGTKARAELAGRYVTVEYVMTDQTVPGLGQYAVLLWSGLCICLCLLL